MTDQNTRSASDIWTKVLDSLQKELSPHVFDRWLKPIQPLDVEEQELLVSVPDEFFKNWIVDHYGGMISMALRDAVEDPSFRVAFKVSPAEPQQAQATETPAAPAADRVAAPLLPGQLSAWDFNSKYIFENFVVGPSNRFAHAACMAVSESPAKAYNPLFIYGAVGLGKTHLMQAIGQEILRRSPKAKVLYITSEMFTNQLINAIKTGTTTKFREKYRTVDCLLIDDIHFIAGKEATMEGFFHTFNALYDAHKQIVVSSDKPPKDIAHLEERLVSRFEWGLVTDIQPPDYETRVAILRKKAEKESLEIPDPVTCFIAEHIKSNIRELEGALIRVVAYSKLVGKVVDEQVAAEVLKDLLVETERKISVDLIQRRVAEYFEIRLSEMTAKKRLKTLVFPRHIAMYLSRELTGLSFPEIGEQFGGRDHTTVLHAYEKIRKDMRKDKKTKASVDKLVDGFRK